MEADTKWVPQGTESRAYRRTFTRADILAFAALTGDEGLHHVDPGRRVMAQGLLVASMVTKLGGDMNYVARNMKIDFIAPVYEGEEVTATLEITKFLRQRRRVKLAMLCECRDESGQVVLRGTSEGHVWSEEPVSEAT